jgi:hypothetical protein
MHKHSPYYCSLPHYLHIHRRTAAVSPKTTRASSSTAAVSSVNSSVKGTAVTRTTDSVACDVTFSTVANKSKDAAAAVHNTTTTTSTTAKVVSVASASVVPVVSAECVQKEASMEKYNKLSTEAIIDE